MSNEINQDISKEKNKNYNDPEQLFNKKIVWLNSKEAADYLRISVQNLRVKISRGEIPVDGRLGKTLRFRREELDRLLETSQRGGPQ